jgi:hypothetical protein
VDALGDQDSDTECTAEVPVPDNAITLVPLDALLATVMLPVTFPVAAGSKVTFSDPVCPGARIVPVGRPLALKPAPDTMTVEIVTLPVPAFVKVTVCWLLFEMLTLPKLKLVELTFRE